MKIDEVKEWIRHAEDDKINKRSYEYKLTDNKRNC